MISWKGIVEKILINNFLKMCQVFLMKFIKQKQENKIIDPLDLAAGNFTKPTRDFCDPLIFKTRAKREVTIRVDKISSK